MNLMWFRFVRFRFARSKEQHSDRVRQVGLNIGHLVTCRSENTKLGVTFIVTTVQL